MKTKEEKKADNAAYYVANRGKILAQTAASRAANPEKVRTVNMMTIDKMIEVLQAAKAGKQIEWRNINGDRCGGGWSTILTSCNSWNFPCCEYRVRKEPRVIYLNSYSDGSLGRGFQSIKDALCVGGSGKVEVLKFVEVTD